MTQPNVFQFLELPRKTPQVIDIHQRTAGHWHELYKPLDTAQAAQQAARCLDCGNPYCSWKCPVHNPIPQWLKLVQEGRMTEAATLCHQTNPLPEVCGRVCPQDRLCEGSCTLEPFGAVTIGAIEKFIVDQAFANGWRPDLSNVPTTPWQVAIVGAGPAGLACADRLAHAGVHADVYDRYEDIGGLLQFGIPNFKLDKSIIAARRAILEDMGICFHLGVEVGQDVGIEKLLKDYDAVFLALGAYRYTDGKLPGQDLPQVLHALPFLVQSQRSRNPYLPSQQVIAGWANNITLPDISGKNIVVLGGGDTGMDCVRTAIRLGAQHVTCVYRRDAAHMPGSAREVANANEEGVNFIFNAQPLAINPNPQGAVESITMITTRLETDDKHGRQKITLIEGTQTRLPADIVIIAFGFSPSAPDWLHTHGVQQQENGRIQLHSQETGALPYQTHHPKLFAGGDCVHGADLVVTAIAHGRDAAASIVQSLKARATQTP